MAMVTELQEVSTSFQPQNGAEPPKRGRGRPRKVKGHIELTQSAVFSDEPPREKVSFGGQHTHCKKCGIEMTMHLQTKISESALKMLVCSSCLK